MCGRGEGGFGGVEWGLVSLGVEESGCLCEAVRHVCMCVRVWLVSGC